MDWVMKVLAVWILANVGLLAFSAFSYGYARLWDRWDNRRRPEYPSR